MNYLQELYQPSLMGIGPPIHKIHLRLSETLGSAKRAFLSFFSEMTDRDIFNLIRAQSTPLAGAYLDTPSGRKRFNEYMSMCEVRALRKKYGY